MATPFSSAACPRCCRHLSVKRLRLNAPRHLTTSTSQPTSPPLPPPSSQGNLTPQSLTLHAYTTTAAPTPAQLRHASAFFSRCAPQILWSTPHFRSIPTSPHPEVCFLGRSNAGKSSLLNALFGRPRAKPAHVSRRPGRTRTMNAFAVGRSLTVRRVGKAKEGGSVDGAGAGGGTVVVVDMPGYGGGSREEWGEEIMKYLTGRRQLRRTFVLVDAEHGVKGSDAALLEELARKGVGHQVLLSKVDKLLSPRARALSARKMDEGLGRLRGRIEEVQERLRFDKLGVRAVADVISCSAEKELEEYGRGKGKIGIDAIRWAMLSACGLGCDENGVVNRGWDEAQYQILEPE